jgi:ribonuclease-3
MTGCWNWLTIAVPAAGTTSGWSFGDAVLGLVIAEALYAAHPGADEGTLSRLRARLVRRETLEEVARELALGELVRLGSGELRSGGHRRGSILANSLEAVFGAVFLDGGWPATRKVVLKVLGTRLAALDTGDDLRDPKTRLQEFLQGRGFALPTYAVERISGSGHAQHFAVVCRLETPGIEVHGECEPTGRRAAGGERRCGPAPTWATMPESHRTASWPSSGGPTWASPRW